MSKLILDVTKEEFENRLVSAIEGAMKSPLVKQRTKVLNDAMVQVLHGGRSDGQHEHNLEQFWKEDSQTVIASTCMWVGTENYRHENSYESDNSTVTGKSKEEVSRKLYTNVLTDLADTVAISIDAEKLVDVIDSTGSSYAANYLAEAEKTVSELGEEDIAELLNYSSNAELEAQEAIFNLVTDMMCIEGSHSIEEVEVEVNQQPEPVKAPEKRHVTIHTIILTRKGEGQDDGIDDIEVFTTLSEELHDQQLLNFFTQYAEENGGFGKDDLIQHNITQDVMSDENMEDDDFESMDFDGVIEWLSEHGRPNMLIDIIPDMTYGMYKIEVQYQHEEI